MSEKLIEKKLRVRVTESGGLAIKIASAWFTGLPDRLVLMPGARVYWAETKSTGKDMSRKQKFVKRLLENLGFTVTKIDCELDLQNFFKLIGA